MKLIDFAIPDIPESLEITVKREQYLAKQALADTQTAKLVRVLLYFPLINKKSQNLCGFGAKHTRQDLCIHGNGYSHIYHRIVANELPLAPINPYRTSNNYAASFGMKIKILTF